MGVVTDISAEDIAAMRAQGDFREFLRSLKAQTADPKPAEAEPEPPAYHIARPGAWPCGTAPTGPTPPPCTHVDLEEPRP